MTVCLGDLLENIARDEKCLGVTNLECRQTSFAIKEYNFSHLSGLCGLCG